MLQLSELLVGSAQALVTPQPEEASGDYAAGMLGVVAMLCVLAAQEADCAAARQYGENREIRALFAAAVQDGSAGAMRVKLNELACGQDDDLRLTALSAAANLLGATLIELHIQAEESESFALEASILHLIRRSTAARRLSIPIQPAN